MAMIFAVMYREFRMRTTSLVWSFFDLAVPLVYLLLFGIGLDRAFTGGVVADHSTLDYRTFFLAGVLSMASFGIAINTAYGFFVDRENGLFYEFLTYPMTRAQFLIGKILFNCILSLAQAALTVGLAVLALDIPIRWTHLPLTAAGIMIGTAGWFFLLSPFALRIKRNDMFNTFINVAYFVLMFASSIFYPTDSMPSWLRWTSLANPLTWHTDVLRYLTTGIGNAALMVAEAVAFTIFLLVSFWFAVHTLRHRIFP